MPTEWQELTRHVPPAPEWAAGYVYLFNTSVQYQKIGFCETLPKRVSNFVRLMPFEMWVEHFFAVGSEKVEKRLHAFFGPRRTRNEWYTLGSDGIALFKTIAEAKEPHNLPPVFWRGSYVREFAPAEVTDPADAEVARFGRRLAKLRLAHGYSLPALAERSGVPHWTLLAFESGKFQCVHWMHVVRIARALGVGTDAFLPPEFCVPTEAEDTIHA